MSLYSIMVRIDRGVKCYEKRRFWWGAKRKAAHNAMCEALIYAPVED
jgi:hypothetical protein